MVTKEGYSSIQSQLCTADPWDRSGTSVTGTGNSRDLILGDSTLLYIQQCSKLTSVRQPQADDFRSGLTK